MRYLVVFLLLILVLNLTARRRKDHQKIDYHDIVCNKKPMILKIVPSILKGVLARGTPEKRCNRWCRKKPKPCQRGKCMEIKGRKTCSCLDCDPKDRTRDEYPRAELEPFPDIFEMRF
ncbi:hypothetical protein Aduo_003202 [Ancylostoma duodenale]